MVKSIRVLPALFVSFVLFAILSLPVFAQDAPVSVSVKNETSHPQYAIAVRSANIILKVPDFQAARNRVLSTVVKYDGELRDAQTEVNLPGQKHGEMAFRVDAAKMDDLIGEIKKVGKLYSEKVQTVDQTSYYDTLERRTAILRQNESELEDFLRRPKRMRGSDILFVQYRLFQTRVQASDAMQARSDLERGAKTSLLSVSLFEPDPKPALDWRNWHALASYRSKGAFMYVIRKLMTAGYFTLWFAPMWIPAVILLFFIVRALNRRVRTWWQIRNAEAEA